MGYIRGCEKCPAPAVPGKTLCADCGGGCEGEKQYYEGIKGARLEKESANAAVIISRKNAEIEALKYKLRMRQKLLWYVFAEYQVLQKIKSVDVLA